MIDFRRLPGRLALLVAPVMLCSPVSPLQAAIYKCTDPDGSVTYSQTACAKQQQPAGVFARQSVSAQDCRIGRSFAADVVEQMQRGATSEAQFQRFGGMQAVPATSMGLISYIYTYNNTEVSASRITALATARCETRSFGPAACEDFPLAWIDAMGGCDAARDPALRRPAAGSQPREQATSFDAPESSVLSAAAGAATAPDACVDRIRGELDTLRARMRQPASVQEHNSMNQRRSALRRALSRCR